MKRFDLRFIFAVAMALTAWQGSVASEPLRYKLPEETAKLRDGTGVQVAQNTCVTCHSVDYIAIQPPKSGSAFWQAEVAKMRNVYKAAISDSDAKIVAEYLAQAY